MHITTCCRWKN